MAKLIVYSLFSVLLLGNVYECFGKSSCAESNYPVCATNGTHWYFFKNLCRLKSENTNRENNGLAKLDITEVANCFKLCNQVCNDEVAPICGVNDEDDQETFENRCEFDLENCRYGKVWTILHEGKCHIGSSSNPEAIQSQPMVEVPLISQPSIETIPKPLPHPHEKPNPESKPIPLPHINPVPEPQAHSHVGPHPVPPQPLPTPQSNVKPNLQPQVQLKPVPEPSLYPNSEPKVEQHLQPHFVPHQGPRFQTYPLPNINPVPHPHEYTHPQQPQVQPAPIPEPISVYPNPETNVEQYQPHFDPHQGPRFQTYPLPQVIPLPNPHAYSHPQPHVQYLPRHYIKPFPHPHYDPHPNSHHKWVKPKPQSKSLPVPQPNVYPIQLPHIQPHPHYHPHPRPHDKPIPHSNAWPNPNHHIHHLQYPHALSFQIPQQHAHPFSYPHYHAQPQTLQHQSAHTYRHPKLQPLSLPQPNVHPIPQPHEQPLPQDQPPQQIPGHSHPLIPHPINRRCPIQCTLEYDPVCATFEGVDQTFENPCYMRADICRSKRAWVLKHNGECVRRCNENCPKIYNPMCATFNGRNKTFNNECLLDLEVCVSGNPWNILHNGQCQNPIQNCPKVCPELYSPVCASYNGERREFQNMCFLQMEACKTKEDWEIVQEGQCEQVIPPHLPQPPYEPTKNCPDVCLAVYDPVCAMFRGSKRTFSNGCELSSRNCKTEQNWRVLYNGACESKHPSPYVPLCSSHYEPICATLNGLRKTFTNKCQMDAEVSGTNHAWTVLGSGVCESLPPYAQPPYQQPGFTEPPFIQPPVVQPPFVQPPFIQPPFVQPPFIQPPFVNPPLDQPPFVLPPLTQPPLQHPTPFPLACPDCSDIYEPVCGLSDGQQQTFNNECLLLSENCYSNKKWTVGYVGICRSEETPRHCPNFCPLNYDPVCATLNGVRRTFPNECELNREAYKTNKKWVIINIGECDYCPDCLDDIAPVCAELNGQTQTFDNVCKVEAENCRTKKEWKIISQTSCGIDDCPQFCPTVYIPVCAISNGVARTFGNVCEMKRETCITNIVWNIASQGECPHPNENCPQACSLQYNPVCAVYQGVSREFINECILRTEICNTHKDWELLNVGPCVDYQQPPCTNSNQDPHPQPIPIPKPEPNCDNRICFAIRGPVCATFNGEEKTFPNNCALSNFKCKTGQDWKMVKSGTCGNTSPRIGIQHKGVHY